MTLSEIANQLDARACNDENLSHLCIMHPNYILGIWLRCTHSYRDSTSKTYIKSYSFATCIRRFNTSKNIHEQLRQFESFNFCVSQLCSDKWEIINEDKTDDLKYA